MKKKLLIVIPILIAVVAFIFVYRYYNHEDGKTSLTVSEKRWVHDHNKTSVDIEVINDYPIYGMDGEGVFFDFIHDFKKDVGLDLNEVPYLKTSKPKKDDIQFRILNDQDKLTNKDLLLFEDYYIAIGKKYERINYISDMKNITYGILEEDKDNISYYLKSATNISYKTYDSIDLLYESLDNDSVTMIIVPNIMYLNKTISNNNYSINYYFTEMTKKIVLTLTDSNQELNDIVSKYYRRWKSLKFVNEYDTEYFDYYVKQNKLSSKDKTALISKIYTYGYVENSPYEVKKNNKIAGIAGEYLNRVARLAGIEFNYKKYANKQALEDAVANREVDIYFDYYGITNDHYNSTLSTFIEEYVVLEHKDNHYIVNSFESLKNKDIVMLSDNALYNYVNSNVKANIKTYSNINSLLKHSKDKLIIIDKNIYDRYHHSKFSKYTFLYQDTMMNDYKFMVRNNNKAFYNLFNYTINTNSYYNYKNSGLESLNESILEGSSFGKIYTIILMIIFIPVIIIFILIHSVRKKKEKKKVKITNKHKYTDMLTSLKNRNYLNIKMPEWESSKVFPQAIVMIDLNNVKYVNDNYGHEEGDQLIVEAAGILVNTQLENSEIIRTDGNEFLIYLVGYSERQISTYTKKLSKELKNLPHEFGAGIGFSMITDEIKTLDDAINEATLEMITDKEDFK